METGGGAGAGGGAADGGKSSKLPQMAPLTKYKLVFLGDQVCSRWRLYTGASRPWRGAGSALRRALTTRCVC